MNKEQLDKGNELQKRIDELKKTITILEDEKNVLKGFTCGDITVNSLNGLKVDKDLDIQLRAVYIKVAVELLFRLRNEFESL